MGQPPFACGILFLVSRVLSKKSESAAFMLEKSFVEFPEDEGDEKYVDVKEEDVETIKVEDLSEVCIFCYS